MQSVVYSCPFIPAEWIAAHGFRPCRIAPSVPPDPGGAAAGVGVCPYAHAFASCAPEEGSCAAVVFTTTCDQMRRISELAALHDGLPTFLMNVPATWQTTVAQRLYRSELLRLGRFLRERGGHAPSDLVEIMVAYSGVRQRLQDLRGQVDARALAEASAAFHATGDFAEPPRAYPAISKIPIALAGGPLQERHFRLFDLVREAGGEVVLDGTSTGERSLVCFDRRRIREDAIGELADAYLGGIPDVFQRPNSRLYQWMRTRLIEREVRGIVIHYYLWCDTWRAEIQRIREWAPVPVLALDAEDDFPSEVRTAARIQAFLETLCARSAS